MSTRKIGFMVHLEVLSGGLDKFFQSLVVDVFGGPFRDLIARQIASKLHSVCRVARGVKEACDSGGLKREGRATGP